MGGLHNLQSKNSCPAKAAEKNTLQGELWGKIEQVLSIVHVLCLTLKKLSQAIAHQKIILNFKVRETFHAQIIDNIEIISFQKQFLPMQKHNDLN